MEHKVSVEMNTGEEHTLVVMGLVVCDEAIDLIERIVQGMRLDEDAGVLEFEVFSCGLGSST